MISSALLALFMTGAPPPTPAAASPATASASKAAPKPSQAKAAPKAPRTLVDRIVAVVNDAVITQHELDQAAAPILASKHTEEEKQATQKAVLDRLIDERLMEGQVIENRIEVEPADIDRAIARIAADNQITPEQLQQAVMDRGMRLHDYRNTLRKQLQSLKLVELKVRSRVVVPEAEVKAEYRRQTLNKPPDVKLHIRHIFLPWSSPDAKTREAVLSQLRAAKAKAEAGTDFGELAKAQSQGPTASEGGDLGELSERSLLPEMAKAVTKLQPGQISDPIETEAGVHLVQLLERKTAETDYERQKAAIYQQLYAREVEAQMQVWLEEIKSEASIQILL